MKVLIAGLGRIGWEMAVRFAKGGHGLALVDFDKVEARNLRYLRGATGNAIGKPKAVAIRELLRVLPLNVESHTLRIQALPFGYLKGMDLMILAMDNIRSLIYGQYLARHFGVPVLQIGIAEHSPYHAQVFYAQGGQSDSCFGCLFHPERVAEAVSTKPLRGLGCAELVEQVAGRSVDTPLDITSAAVNLAMDTVERIKAGTAQPGLYSLNLASGQPVVRRVTVSTRGDCPIHELTPMEDIKVVEGKGITLYDLFKKVGYGPDATTLYPHRPLVATVRCKDCGNAVRAAQRDLVPLLYGGEKCLACGGDYIADEVHECLVGEDQGGQPLVALGVLHNDTFSAFSGMRRIGELMVRGRKWES